MRSIYVLRSGNSPNNLEHAKAVLVTSNSGFAKAAFEYGKDHEESREVSSVINDFSLANMAWLKAPLGAPTLPITEVISFSYAALQPPKGLLDKFLEEIDKLEKQGTITERDHQLLRSSELAQRELMNLTLGEEDALTDQTVTATLRRVTQEIKKEESDKYHAEQAEHRKTLEELASVQAEKQLVRSRLYWRCLKKAKICAWCISILFGLLLVLGFLVGLGLASDTPVLGWIFIVSSGVFIIATLGNLIGGATIAGLHGWVQTNSLTWFLKRESASTGLNLEEVK